MLARLARLEGVANAAIDRSGTVLRVQLRTPETADTIVKAIRRTLAEAGVEASVLRGLSRETALLVIERWYDQGSVGELTRMEMGALQSLEHPDPD